MQFKTSHIVPEKIPAQWLTKQEHEVYVLRLDNIHPLVSGNKWLKLQGWIELANQFDRAGILTKGGPWSNHIHAAAAWCYFSGKPFHAVIKGNSDHSTPMLQDVLNWNGHITWVNNTKFNDDEHWEAMAASQKLQFVPMGGDGPDGEQGVKSYFDQFSHWQFDEIWCAIGTGTTLAGMAASGIQSPKIVAINPGLSDKALLKKIEEIREKYPGREIIELADPADKFGRLLPTQMPSMNEWWLETGMPTDIVYTGKLITHFMEQLKAEPISKRILIVHTGGLQGNRSLPDGLLKFTG